MKLILAPLRGITNAVFRKIYHRHFPYFDYAVAPFVAPTAAKTLGKGLFSDLLAEANKDSMPAEPQILLNNAEVLYPFLDKIFELGYTKFNINMGCPAAVAVKKNKGAALMERSDLLDKILQVCAADKRFAFSVKLRLGMNDKKRIFEVLPLIRKYGARDLIIHPRTAEMQYSGEADIDAFEEILKEIFGDSINTVYNGDVFSLAKFELLSKRFGEKIQSLMIGRGALVNPLLTGLIKGEKFDDPQAAIFNFVSDLYNEYKAVYYGEKPVLGKMKELWKYLSFSFDGGQKSAKKIMKSQSLSSYEKHCAQLFENCKFLCNKNILGNIQIEETVQNND